MDGLLATEPENFMQAKKPPEILHLAKKHRGRFLASCREKFQLENAHSCECKVCKRACKLYVHNLLSVQWTLCADVSYLVVYYTSSSFHRKCNLHAFIKIKTLEEVHCAKWIWSKLKTNLILQVIIDHFPSNCILWHASGFESESHIHSTFKYNFPKTGHQDNVRTKNNLQQCIQLKRTWISWTVANIKISFLQWNCG